jgi:hypothetical protein
MSEPTTKQPPDPWTEEKAESHYKRLAMSHLLTLVGAARSIPDNALNETVCRNIDRTFAEGDRQSYAFWTGVSFAFDEMRERGYLADGFAKQFKTEAGQ